MYFFIDESNIPRFDKIEPSSPYFIMGGCLVQEHDLQKISQDLETFAKNEFPDLVSLPDFKLHASDMFNARGNFSGKNKLELNEKCEKFIELILKFPVEMVSTGIQKQKLVEKYKEKTYDPYNLAFLYSCERFENFLEEKKIDMGKVFLETRGPGLDKKYGEGLDRFLQMGPVYKRIRRVSRPVFTKSTISSPLQISDFVCYSIHKMLNKSEPRLFEKLKPKFRNQNGKVEGFGLVIFPK